LKLLEQKGEEVTAVMSDIPGMHDVKLLRDFGQPNLDLTIDRRQAARFGINVTDIQDAVQTPWWERGEPGSDRRAAL